MLSGWTVEVSSLFGYLNGDFWFVCHSDFLVDLDNTEKNEKLKFSIIVRLPPVILNPILFSP